MTDLKGFLYLEGYFCDINNYIGFFAKLWLLLGLTSMCLFD
jgi:hypothetical protein